MARSDSERTHDDTLSEVVDVERQIKSLLDAETAKAEAWRDRRVREIDEARQAQCAELEREQARQLTAARSEAAARAAVIVRQARAEASRIERLDEAELADVVWRHIARIAPVADA